MIAVIDRGVDERAHERSWGPGRGFQLWLEKRRDEKGMTQQLHDPRVAAIVLADDVQSRPLDRAAEFRIEPVTAMIPLDDTPPPIDRRRATSRVEEYRRGLANERAGQGSDDWCRRFRIRLAVIGVPQTGNVARILEHRVLESAADAEEGESAETRMTNCGERAIKTGIRASGREPDGVRQCEPRLDVRVERRGRDPTPLECVLAQLANMTECFIDREVSVHRRIVIADNGETRGNGHVVLRPRPRNLRTQLRVSGSGLNLKTLTTGRRQVPKRLRPKKPNALVGDAAKLLPMARGFGAVAAGRHVAPAATTVLSAVVKHAHTARIGATTNAGQFAENERVGR